MEGKLKHSPRHDGELITVVRNNGNATREHQRNRGAYLLALPDFE